MGYLYFFTILVEGHFTKLVYMSLTSFGLTLTTPPLRAWHAHHTVTPPAVRVRIVF